MFITTGLVGILWSACFFALYRDPQKPQPGRPSARTAQPSNSPAVAAGRAFRNRRLWGLLMAHSSETAANWFFLTWFSNT